MSQKSINFKRPNRDSVHAHGSAMTPPADAWVEARDAGPAVPATSASAPIGPSKRFTVDVPLDLHRRMKLACVNRDVHMSDIIRELLLREFPEEGAKA